LDRQIALAGGFNFGESEILEFIEFRLRCMGVDIDIEKDFHYTT